MEGLPEELEFEIEALRATYGDEAVHVEPASSSSGGSDSSPAVALVSLPVAPRCEAEHEHFVAGRLVMAVGAGYPAEPPAVQLADAKGLGDARLAGIQSALEAEAAAMPGELQLGHLCETALDQLTAANQPEGGCAFCLEPLLGAGGGECSGDGLPVVRLACFHCYHTACFAPWWQWQQRRSSQREAQLWSEYKAMAPLKLEEEGIRREPLAAGAGGSGGSSIGLGSSANGAAEAAAERQVEGEGEEDGSGGGGGSKGPGEAYVLLCPACRADIAPSSLAHAWHQLQAATADSWSGGAQSSAGSRAALDRLPAEQRQALLAMQQRHAAVMRRQQACGGIVDATHSVSISDLQQAAAAAAAAEAAAAEAAALAAAQQVQQAQHSGPGRGGSRRGRGGPHAPGGRGPPPGFPGRQQGEGRGEGGRQPQTGRGRGRGGGRGRAGRHGDGPAAGGASLAAAEGALAGMQLVDHPPHHHQQPHRPQQQQAQQQHRQGSGSRPQGGSGRGSRGGRHGRGGDGRGRGRGRESAAGIATAGNTPHNS